MSTSLETQWKECLTILKDNLHNDQAFNAFFATLSPISFLDHRLKVAVPSYYVYEQIEKGQYFNLWTMTLRRVFGMKTSLSYVVAVVQEQKPKADEPKTVDEAASVKISHEEHAEAVDATATFETRLDPTRTFDNYFSGQSNKLAYSTAMTVCKQPGMSGFNPFFIFGASGVGKTHLAEAIGSCIVDQFPEKKVLYVTAYEFKVQYGNAVRFNKLNDFIQYYQGVDVLIVDDIQEFAGKNLIATQNTFFHIFNHLHLLGKQLIMTCDRPPVDLDELVPRLLTRFKWGFTGEIEHPDYDLRRQILVNKCERDGLSIGNDVVEYIARNATDNVRDLEGIINSLLAHSIVFNRPINRELAERVLHMIVKTEAKVITCETVIDLVAERFGIDQKSIHSKSRKREIVQARQAAMNLCKQYTTQTATKIGNIVGGRDHATVLHAFQSVNDMLATDEAFKEKYEAVEKDLKER